MSPYRLVIPPAFKKRKNKKPPQMQDSINECVKRLAQNPRHPGLNSHRVQGHKIAWESYVDQANRVTWHYGDGNTIVLRNNCNHDVPARNP